MVTRSAPTAAGPRLLALMRSCPRFGPGRPLKLAPLVALPMLLWPAARADVGSPESDIPVSQRSSLFPKLQQAGLKPFENLLPLWVSARALPQPAGHCLKQAFVNYEYRDSARQAHQVPLVLTLARAGAAPAAAPATLPTGLTVAPVQGAPGSWVKVRVQQASPSAFQSFLGKLPPPQRDTVQRGIALHLQRIGFDMRSPADRRACLHVTIGGGVPAAARQARPGTFTADSRAPQSSPGER